MNTTHSATGTPTFLVPFDFSSHARSALETAVDLAVPLDGDLQLLHVLEPAPRSLERADPSPMATHARSMALRDDRARDLAVVARQIDERVDRVGLEVVEGSRPDYMICDYADRIDADMIVMGTQGRSRLARVFLGSVAERTLREAPCPVLSVNASAETAAGSSTRVADPHEKAEPLQLPTKAEDVRRREGLRP